MQKRETVETFRRRLAELIQRTGLSRAQFAAWAGLDRSTLTQLLSAENVRLPRAETIARIASRHSASIDWLMGLSEQDQVAADIVPQLAIEPDAASPADERLKRWHEEARGFKVRYVPATLPDQLKTDALIGYESGQFGAAAADAWSGVARARIAHAQRPDSEIEVCAPLQRFEIFAAGEGIWRDLPARGSRRRATPCGERGEEPLSVVPLFLYDGRAALLRALYGVRSQAGGHLCGRHVLRLHLDGAHPGTHPALRRSHPQRAHPAERSGRIHRLARRTTALTASD